MMLKLYKKNLFKLDVDKPRLDLYSIIQKEAKQSSISKVKGVKRCFLNQSTLPSDNGCFKLTTEGINVEVRRISGKKKSNYLILLQYIYTMGQI